MRKAWSVLGLMGFFLASCATVPVERKSPCACDWQPINQQTENVIS